MKKYLLILFVFFGLNTQAQFFNYCDSISIGITASTPTSVSYQSTPLVFPASFYVDYFWTVTDFNTGTLITGDTVTNPIFSLNSLDTVTVCLNFQVSGNGMTSTCLMCDTIMYNGAWVQYSVGQPMGVESEIPDVKQIFKIVDFLGRETKQVKNTPMFYIYNDGTVEKKMIVE